MTAIEIFNVCTHGKDGGGGLSMAIPTPCSISTHPTNPKRFASGGGDANVFIWHFADGAGGSGLEAVAKLTYHTQPCNAVSWSASGEQLATSGDDKMIAIWSRDAQYDATDAAPAFGETMVFGEKWLPTIKIRGPLAEVCAVEWLHGDKAVLAAALDGSIGLYSLKKQQHILSIHVNTQFIQGIAIDASFNLLAVQSTSASAKVYRLIRHRKKKSDKQNKRPRYRSVQHCSLSYYPPSAAEAAQQLEFNRLYKEEKEEIKRERDAQIQAQAQAQAQPEAESTTATVSAPANVPSVPKRKAKKKKVAKHALFKHNLITTSRKPGWSADGLLLCMVAGQSKDKAVDAVHVFHRSCLSKKVSTILLPESSHATAAAFNPMKLKLPEQGAEKGSIAERYGMCYRMLLAILCGQELFLFDTAKNEAALYWKDQDTQGFFDVHWSCDGRWLVISDVEGFITRVHVDQEDLLLHT